MAITPTSLPETVTVGQPGHITHSSAAYAAINALTAWATGLVSHSADNGVVGNGTADDTAAMNSWLAAAASAGMVAQLQAGAVVRVASGQVTIPSGTRLNLNGATIRNVRSGVNDRLLVVSGVADVWIGNGILDGAKASYATATEQRHNIYIVNSDRVTVDNVISKNAKGDGVYVGDHLTGASTAVALYNVTCDGNHRQGLSVCHVDGLVAVGCRFINTSGTAPQAGVDIEPNNAGVICSDLRFIGCEFSGNTGAGVTAVMQPSPTVRQGGIEVIGCHIAGNSASGVILCDVTDFRMVGGSSRLNTEQGILITHSVGTSNRNLIFSSVEIDANLRTGLLVGTSALVDGLLVTGCTVVNNGTLSPNNDSGVNITPLTGSKNVQIIGCRFDGASMRYAVRTAAELSHLTMIGNYYGTLGTGISVLADDTTTRYVLDRAQTATHKQAYVGASTASVIDLYTTGESQPRISMRTDAFVFSSGSATQDTILQRAAANVLAVGADDCFKTGRNTTANRPTASAAGQGSMFYDTTLGKPIWSDGTNWKDAAGTTV